MNNIPTPHIYVFAKVSQARIADMDGTFDQREANSFALEIVGALGGFELNRDWSNVNEVSAALAQAGMQLRWVTRAVRRTDGAIGAFVIPSVVVETVDDARELPDFREFFCFTGYHEAVEKAA